MTRRAAALAAAAMLLGGAGTGAAEPKPATRPTRDVDLTYSVPRPDAAPGAPALVERIRWSVTEGKQRVDLPTPGVYVITDFRAHRLATISEYERKVLEMDASEAGVGSGATSGSPTFTRRGETMVAGLNCMQWETRDTSGQPALVCLTEDGVTLRAAGAGRTLLEATKVAYGPIDPAAFRIPDGFLRIEATRPVQVKP